MVTDNFTATDRYGAGVDDAVKRAATEVMLRVVNAWHREVGIDEILKSRLTLKIADVVASSVFEGVFAEMAREIEGLRSVAGSDPDGWLLKPEGRGLKSVWKDGVCVGLAVQVGSYWRAHDRGVNLIDPTLFVSPRGTLDVFKATLPTPGGSDGR